MEFCELVIHDNQMAIEHWLYLLLVQMITVIYWLGFELNVRWLIICLSFLLFGFLCFFLCSRGFLKIFFAKVIDFCWKDWEKWCYVKNTVILCSEFYCDHLSCFVFVCSCICLVTFVLSCFCVLCCFQWSN